MKVISICCSVSAGCVYRLPLLLVSRHSLQNMGIMIDVAVCFHSGGDGDDEHLQAAEVPAGAEWLQPLDDLRPPVYTGLPAEELHSSNRQHLPERPRWRTQAVEVTERCYREPCG